LARLDALEPFGEELRAHMDEPLGGGVTRGPVLKLAALLHDVAKPETRRVVEGRVRFFEHDLVGAERVRAIGRRLRLPERAAAVAGAPPLRVWRHAALIRDLLGGWEEQQAVEAAPPLLRGEDVMARLGLSPGPAVGHLLVRVREAQALGRVGTRAEALAYLDSLSAEP